MSSPTDAGSSPECNICCQKKPHYGFHDWMCSGHPEHICKDCAAKCLKCPFCRAEPRIQPLPQPPPPEAVIYEYLFETPYPNTQNIINNVVNDIINNRDISVINITMIYINNTIAPAAEAGGPYNLL